ncbi:MAG: acetolactate synthase large subunit [Chloroflexota bacterium]
MNGAQSLIQTLVNGRVDVCFTNPGTSEMHFVAAVDKVEGMRTVLCLFEGVCSGAADGYSRMTGRPASTLLHLGPGLGNALANVHNTRRAHVPLINIVGEHARHHLEHNAPLTTDIEAIAWPVSDWVRTIGDPMTVAEDAADAIAAAQQPPGQVATLILPGDCAWNESSAPAPGPAVSRPPAVEDTQIRQIADVLRRGEPCVLLMAGPGLLESSLHSAGRIADVTGARLFSDRPIQRWQRGAGRVPIQRIPYPVKDAVAALDGTTHMILVGTVPPVAFFGYPNTPSLLAPDSCQFHTLATLEEDIPAALAMLADELTAPPEPSTLSKLNRPDLPTGELIPDKIWATIAALMPEEAILTNEAITSAAGYDRYMDGGPPHDMLTLNGGSIGEGLPLTLGASIACPDRKVINAQADGSAMYTVQTLWSLAREKCDTVTVLFNNRAYRILQGEMLKVEADGGGSKSQAMLDLGNPVIDWVHIAQGMGVNAWRATTAEEFNTQFAAAVQTPGPHLIDAVI